MRSHHQRPHHGNYQNQQYYDQHYQPTQDSHSVILVTAGYDHTIRFWEALSGICSRTIQHPDSVSRSERTINWAQITDFMYEY